MNKAKKKITSASGELMQALNITPDDLVANNAGYISEHQKEMMSTAEFGAHGTLYTAGCLMILIAVPIVAIAGGLAFFSAPIVDVYLALTVAGILSGIGVLLFAIGRVKRATLAKDLEQAEFITMQGIAIVHLDDNTSKFEINDQTFDVSREVVLRIKHLEPYVIHYLPKSKTILSMERIADNSNLRDTD